MVIYIKTINIKDYNPSMGILIDVQHPLDYQKKHYPGSINIYYEKLMYGHEKYLKKNQNYYITCAKGKLSKKVVSVLEYYGYNVTQALN